MARDIRLLHTEEEVEELLRQFTERGIQFDDLGDPDR